VFAHCEALWLRAEMSVGSRDESAVGPSNAAAPHDLIGDGMRPITDDATPPPPDPDDHVARLRSQIDTAKARRAGYRAQAAETVDRGGPERPRDEELGIIKTDDTVGRIAADASQEVRSRLRRLTSRFGRRGKK
jgi:hypothetical protein